MNLFIIILISYSLTSQSYITNTFKQTILASTKIVAADLLTKNEYGETFFEKVYIIYKEILSALALISLFHLRLQLIVANQNYKKNNRPLVIK